MSQPTSPYHTIESLAADIQYLKNALGNADQTIVEKQTLIREQQKKLEEINQLNQALVSNLNAAVNKIGSSHDSGAQLMSAVAELKNAIDSKKTPKDKDFMKYNGTLPAKCTEFLTNLKLHFYHYRQSYPTFEDQMFFVYQHLEGVAWKWFQPYVLQNDGVFTYNFASYDKFEQQFQANFGEKNQKLKAENSLFHLKQGNRPVAKLVAELNQLKTYTTWNEDAIYAAFRNALNDSIKDVLAAQPSDVPITLNEFIELAIRIDESQSDRRRQKDASIKRSQSPRRSETPPVFRASSAQSYAPIVNGAGPMDLDANGRLTTEAKEYRRQHNLCGYCGGTHSLEHCTKLAQKEKSRPASSFAATLPHAVPTTGTPASDSTITNQSGKAKART